jgi:KaiC/GvpD/RAD55 family RecA-like ATPase
MDRLSSGVINLDGNIQGGFFKGSVNLITGKTGTGKTAFCASFIHQGIKEDQPGVYITTEEASEDIKKDVEEMFGWNLSQYESGGSTGPITEGGSSKELLRIISIKPVFPTKKIDNLNRLVRGYLSDFMNKLEQNVKEMNAERVVIDSVSLIEMFVQNEYLARVALSSLIKKLKDMGITALLVGTVPETSEGLTGGGITEYLVDSVIKLEFTPVAEEYNRTLEIRKMRRTNHAIEIFPIKITSQGLKLIQEGLQLE